MWAGCIPAVTHRWRELQLLVSFGCYGNDTLIILTTAVPQGSTCFSVAVSQYILQKT